MAGERERLVAVMADLDGILAALADPMEGMEDVLMVDLQDVPRRAVGEDLVKFQDFRRRLAELKEKAGDVLSTPYPDFPAVSKLPGVAEDVAEQARTVNAVAALYAGSPTAAALNLSAGPVEPKG